MVLVYGKAVSKIKVSAAALTKRCVADVASKVRPKRHMLVGTV